MSLFSRSEGRESASRLYRIKNSLTAGNYLAGEQFDCAVDNLLQLQMATLVGSDENRTLEISGHGRAWLMKNFHWVRGDVATLEPNDEAWVMTSPEHPIQSAKKN